jgi:hypothetical protein
MFDFKARAGKIPGWLTKAEGNFLYEAAKNVPAGRVVVEIGSWKGRTTVCLGCGAKDGNRVAVFAVDPHTGSKEHHWWFGKVDTYGDFLKNIKEANLEDFVIPKRETSEEAARESQDVVGFVLVDGGHDFKDVKSDYESWFPKLASGGLISFHDCWDALPVQFFTAQVLLSDRVRRPRLIDNLTVMEKTDRTTFTERIFNLLFIIYRFFFGWIGMLKKNLFGTIIN